MLRTARPHTTLLLASVTVAATLLLSAVSTAHAGPVAPQLSISVDNGQTSATVGDTLTYAVVVKNLGATRVRQLRVSQTVPEGLELTSADKSGRATRSGVVWKVDLAPTGQTVLHATMEVGATPDDLLRLATVACAGMSASKPPVVCATHSDELPAGAAAVAAADPDDDAASTGFTTVDYVCLGGLTLVLVGLAGFVLRRRRVRVARH